MKPNFAFIIGFAIILLVAVAYLERQNIHNSFTYGWSDWPSHASAEKCPWIKAVFEKAGITAFIESCSDPSAYDPVAGYAMVFSDHDNKIVGKWTTNPDYEFTIEVFSKKMDQKPVDVMEEWLAKLTSQQKQICEIQNANQPLEYFADGNLLVTKDPHPTLHKTRYKIDVKPAVLASILDKYDGNPGGGEGRDYMCGTTVGTLWGGHPPYFEFDDRSPDKYLVIGAYGHEGPMIDLNSIRF